MAFSLGVASETYNDPTYRTEGPYAPAGYGVLVRHWHEDPKQWFVNSQFQGGDAELARITDELAHCVLEKMESLVAMLEAGRLSSAQYREIHKSLQQERGQLAEFECEYEKRREEAKLRVAELEATLALARARRDLLVEREAQVEHALAGVKEGGLILRRIGG